jgi:superfamily II DNA or RNA helicase
VSRKLRDYQADAVDDTFARWRDGDRRLAGAGATGLGKSTILTATLARHLAEDPSHRVLMLAHRTELGDQLTETFGEVMPGVRVGRVQAQLNRADARVVMASTATVGKWSRSSGRLPRLERILEHGPITAIGYDEFHHAAAPSNRRILDALPDALLLGVSATLTRADRYGLGDLVHPKEAFAYDTIFGITNGYLVTPRGKVVVADHLDLKRAKVTVSVSGGRDYQDAQLGEMIAQDAGQIVQAWLDHGENRPTAGFFPTIDSAREVLEEFQARGVAAEMVTGQTPTGDGMFHRGSATRGTGIYGRLARGETRVLVGVMVTTEGWDCPPVSCILMGRPTRLEHLYQQIVGRGLRPVQDWQVRDWGWVPKPDGCLVLDVVGASRGQKLASLIDLVPGAEVDLSALDSVPCEECGKVRCTCEGVGADRDPDGGRRRLKGPAFYEDFDLLLSADGAGDRWLATDAGHPVLYADSLDRFAVILAERAGTYRVGTVTRRGHHRPESLGRGLSLDQARQVAEDWAIGVRPALGHRGAAWRTKSRGAPSTQLYRRARRLDLDPEAFPSAAELADAVAVRETSGRMDLLGQGAAAGRGAG